MAFTIDDFLIATNSDVLYNELVTTLQSRYLLKDLSVAEHIIGWSLHCLPGH